VPFILEKTFRRYSNQHLDTIEPHFGAPDVSYHSASSLPHVYRARVASFFSLVIARTANRLSGG
jgi:hypothetical protein